MLERHVSQVGCDLRKHTVARLKKRRRYEVSVDDFDGIDRSTL